MSEKHLIAAPLAGNILGHPGGDFVIAEWQDPGAPPGPPSYIAPLHIHHQDDEAWYVLEGTLCVLSGDTVIEAHAGSGVFVPKGNKHTYWNPTQQRTRYLLIMTPQIDRLIKAIHAMSGRTPEKMKALFVEFGSELL
ncbi:MAG TPA: cupin domain-containing protein [Bryobacteraceae bacterium]